VPEREGRRVVIALLLLLFLALSCSRSREDGPAGTPLSIRVVARGEIEVTWAASGPLQGQTVPDVRYSTSPLTVEIWNQARAVDLGHSVTEDGVAKVRGTLRGLPPVVHYVAARTRKEAPGSLSPIITVLPLRETVLHGKRAGHYFGHAVALAGDVNGDGYADLLVGAPWSDEGLEAHRPVYVQWVRAFLRRIGLSLHGANVGAASLYLGGPKGPAATPAWTRLGRAEGELLGSAVAYVGDLNGDGFADFAVGSPGHDTELRNEGAVAVYLGRRGPISSEPDLFLVGRTRDESFGSAIAGGDFNGDGYSDLVVGAPGSNLGAINGGAVFVFYGGPSGPSSRPGTVLVGKTFDGLFGSAVAAVGDLNRDGYEDLLVGAYEGVADPGAAGAVYVYSGGASGLGSTPALTLRGERGGDQFGSALAALGDVNRDGFPDFAVGARKNDKAGEAAGAVYVYHGGPRGPLPEPRTILRGPGPGVQFGAALAGVGDLDGDGYADLLVGAFGAGRSAEGAVFLHLGGAAGIRQAAALVLRGGSPGVHFGRAMAGGGDLDGDGHRDFAVGSEGESARGREAGAVFVRF
jgi:hypothetical protein